MSLYSIFFVLRGTEDYIEVDYADTKHVFHIIDCLPALPPSSPMFVVHRTSKQLSLLLCISVYTEILNSFLNTFPEEFLPPYLDFSYMHMPLSPKRWDFRCVPQSLTIWC